MTFFDEKCLPNKLNFFDSEFSIDYFFFLVSIESFNRVFFINIDYRFFDELISVGLDRITCGYNNTS